MADRYMVRKGVRPLNYKNVSSCINEEIMVDWENKKIIGISPEGEEVELGYGGGEDDTPGTVIQGNPNLLDLTRYFPDSNGNYIYTSEGFNYATKYGSLVNIAKLPMIAKTSRVTYDRERKAIKLLPDWDDGEITEGIFFNTVYQTNPNEVTEYTIESTFGDVTLYNVPAPNAYPLLEWGKEYTISFYAEVTDGVEQVSALQFVLGYIGGLGPSDIHKFISKYVLNGEVLIDDEHDINDISSKYEGYSVYGTKLYINPNQKEKYVINFKFKTYEEANAALTGSDPITSFDEHPYICTGLVNYPTGLFEDNGAVFYISDFKLEEGSEATDYCESTNDAYYYKQIYGNMNGYESMSSSSGTDDIDLSNLAQEIEALSSLFEE